MMTELSLNILDVAENSTKGRRRTGPYYRGCRFFIRPSDHLNLRRRMRNDERTGGAGNGSFFTSRTTRKVGLGVPFFKYAAESAGGSFTIASVPGKGTDVTATFVLSHIDRMPLGDISSTIHTLIVYHPDTDFVYTYRYNKSHFTLDTRQFREILGDLPFDSPEISTYIMEYLTENKLETDGGAWY